MNFNQQMRLVRTPNQVGPEKYHHDVLARIVAEVSQDHSHLRRFIYEFARVKLRKDLYPRFVEGAWSEIEEQVRSLEAAISQIEADFGQNAPELQFNSQPALPDQKQTGPSRSPAFLRLASQVTTRFGEAVIHAGMLLRARPYGASALPIAAGADDRLADAYLGKHLRSRFWRNIQLIAAAAVGAASYFASDLGSHRQDGLMKVAATYEADKEHKVVIHNVELDPKSSGVNPQQSPDIPIPTDYGVYAVVNGHLTELEQLPIRVPDPRVALSAPISIPSRTHLPIGQFRFVIFRRDLANSAPDRLTVRIVAQVKHALTFGPGGKAKMTDVKQTWVIRNNSYDMRVAPLANNPEMIIVRPDPPDFLFPAGRYALVMKGVGYDFAADGQVTDLAHCLERTEALDASFFSECSKL